MALFSCNQDSKQDGPVKPDNLISDEAIIPIIIELQVLESHYHRNFSRADLYKASLDSASYFVFEKHGVNKEQFERSYSYYSFDIDRMYTIYEATLDSINAQISETGQVQQID